MGVGYDNHVLTHGQHKGRRHSGNILCGSARDETYICPFESASACPFKGHVAR